MDYFNSSNWFDYFKLTIHRISKPERILKITLSSFHLVQYVPNHHDHCHQAFVKQLIALLRDSDAAEVHL